MAVRVIVNPKAGRARHQIEKLLKRLAKRNVRFELCETARPGHASELARLAREDGVEVLAVAGGDGTLNEVAQAYVDASGAALSGPALAVIPAGTGGDFRKTLTPDDSIDAAVDRIASGKDTPVDLGLLRATADDDSRIARAFINITSFGIGGLTDRIVNDGPKWLGGKGAFFLGTVQAMLRYRNQPVRVTVDGAPFVEDRIVNVAIANGRFFGGGMMIAPDAKLSDGYFDVVALGDIPRRSGLSLVSKIYRGTHIDEQRVSVVKGKHVLAEPLDGDPVLIDMDGETPGKLPLEASVLPGALHVRC